MTALTPNPARLDIVIIQGADWNYPVRVCDSAGAQLDLTGWSGVAKVRADPNDDAPALVITVSVGSFGSGATAHNVLLTVADTISAGLADWGDGRWGLRLQDTFGNRTRVLEGQAFLSRDVIQ